MKLSRKANVGGKWIAIQRGLWADRCGWPFQRQCWSLGLPTVEKAETLSELLREAVTQVRETAVPLKSANAGGGDTCARLY